MEEDDNEVKGPLMFCVTKVMNPGPAKIGKLGEGINLPVVVIVSTLMWMASTAIVFMMTAFVIFQSFLATIIAGVTGAAVGKFLDQWSPLKGEKILTWAGLALTTRADSLKVDGQRARVYIGTVMVGKIPAGKIRAVSNCVEIVPGSVDDSFHPLSQDGEMKTLPWPQPARLPASDAARTFSMPKSPHDAVM